MGGILASILLAGCSDAPPRPLHLTPAPTHTAEQQVPPAPREISLRSTDSEVLASATAAFSGYVAASDQLSANPHLGLRTLAPWVTHDMYLAESADFDRSVKSGERLVGATRLSQFVVQGKPRQMGTELLVNLFVCMDISDVAHVGASGEKLPRTGPLVTFVVRVVLAQSPATAHRLAVKEVDGWARADHC
ncbi:hypothetical protein [Galbitalea soli]|uniref:Uncharacterized protein n=1 Tax=Galbitalea soli TaxID=1268042 RepID=A0A7C9TQC1_9MICO|nr:hypothetical protein [Galbitalea soli]NEM90841.1 hypothetical protein [Galbitalea soli]NYJ31561.1 hypothetical protein [Galbitalea soli]